eukprot:525240_1
MSLSTVKFNKSRPEEDEIIQQHQQIMNKANIDIDLKQIFKSGKQMIKCDRTSSNCLSLTRMYVGLKYYQISTQNQNDHTNIKDMFDSFNNMVYSSSILNDYIHIIKKHTDS